MSNRETGRYEPIYMEVKDIKLNEVNPRYIEDDKFRKLVQSIKKFPKMLDIRPIVVDEDMVVLGGNMRYRACLEAGLERVPVMRVLDLTEKQKQEFIVKDNIAYGKWDWDMLANQFDAYQLDEWALDIDPSMFNVDGDDDSMDEATDTSKFNDYTIYFANEAQMDVWYSFLRKLKNKFADYDNVSQRVLAYVADVYDDNDMKESELILKFIEYDIDDE